jgi:hypothetical protein
MESGRPRDTHTAVGGHTGDADDTSGMAPSDGGRITGRRHARASLHGGEQRMDATSTNETRLSDGARREFLNGNALALRGHTKADIEFITSTWLRSYRDSAPRGVSNDLYYAAEHTAIERMWVAPEVTWLVATTQKYPTYILGWFCGELTDIGPVIHYVYVRHGVRQRPDPTTGAVESLDIRHRRIASAMWESFTRDVSYSRVFYTRETPDARSLIRAKGLMAPQPGAPGFNYHPYLGFKHYAR